MICSPQKYAPPPPLPGAACTHLAEHTQHHKTPPLPQPPLLHFQSQPPPASAVATIAAQVEPRHQPAPLSCPVSSSSRLHCLQLQLGSVNHNCHRDVLDCCIVPLHPKMKTAACPPKCSKIKDVRVSFLIFFFQSGILPHTLRYLYASPHRYWSKMCIVLVRL